MSCTSIERIPNEPFVLFTFEGDLDLEILIDAFSRAKPQYDDVIAETGGCVFTIIDVSRAATDFVRMMDVLKHGDKIGAEYQELGGDWHMSMVGTDAMAKFYVQAAKQQQFGGQQIPLFANLDAALDAARLEYHKTIPVPMSA